jgi:hypothetical protein
MGDRIVLLHRLHEERDDVPAVRGSGRRLVEHDVERAGHPVHVLADLSALGGSRRFGLEERAFGGPDFVDLFAMLDLVAGDLRHALGAEDLGVDVRKMGEVEKVLHHPEAGGADVHAAAIDGAAVGLVVFGQGEDGPTRAPEARPQMPVAEVKGQRAVSTQFGDFERPAGPATDFKVGAQQAGGLGRPGGKIADGAQHVPLVERRLIAGLGHQATFATVSASSRKPRTAAA